MQDVQATLPVGSVVRDRYIIEDLLGKGGFGAVYLVRDQRVRGNQFALKEVADSSEEERDRFTFECEVLKRLDHHALPRVYRVFEDDKNNRAYILMDYVAGPNLEVLRLQQPEKRFTLPQVMNIMAPIVNAVGYLHSQHPPIIHRDIKPANIIVPTSGDNAVLVDFGIAKEYDQDSTTTAIRRCSPGYGAPEQYARGTNTQTDIYGLAATFYALLTGTVPADALYRMTQLGSRGVDALEPINQLVPSISPAIAEVVHRGMAINSNDRFASVKDFWRALNEHQQWTPAPIAPLFAPVQHTPLPVAADETVPTVTIYRQTQKARSRRRGGFFLLFLALALLALVIGIAFGTGLVPSLFHVAQSGPIAHTTPTRVITQTPQHTPTATPTTTSTKPTATATTVPTAPPVSPYPGLIPFYNDNIHNTPANVGAAMSLTQIKQQGANFTGYLTIYGSQLQGSGNFTGTVTTGRSITFLVQSFAGHLPLLFTGKIAADGSMTGNYCSARNGQCDYTGGGYGVWSVNAPSSQSSIPSGSSAFVDVSQGSGKGNSYTFNTGFNG